MLGVSDGAGVAINAVDQRVIGPGSACRPARVSPDGGARRRSTSGRARCATRTSCSLLLSVTPTVVCFAGALRLVLRRSCSRRWPRRWAGYHAKRLASLVVVSVAIGRRGPLGSCGSRDCSACVSTVVNCPCGIIRAIDARTSSPPAASSARAAPVSRAFARARAPFDRSAGRRRHGVFRRVRRVELPQPDRSLR